jgi:hypothetical protein
VTKFILDNYLMDPGNTKPVLFCQHAPSSNGAIVELSSVEETNRLVKLECKNRGPFRGLFWGEQGVI